ncbi:hypothetical protein QQS21_005872 [Conoideocrella luteorostrata]|uniref:Rab-GAP TBC domain-containing protein n=1 Tax=Conoideocrella luteorostrata TaxID=1105319 RepID=A0AAJ0CPK3_9HYPO|nr:hypothetical protein QQS21_005872 [Conoideocrella luteorostrata]
MLPSRFASVRQKSRTGAGVGKASFRDDTNLVGFRYEKTKPAEPPIPLPPAKNPLRSSSSLTISRSNTIATTASRSTRPSSVASSSHTNSNTNSPVVVAPPASAFMPGVAPPSEQHPALRSPLPTNALCSQDGKRDSGHAATATSDNIIHEEDCEDDFTSHDEPPLTSEKKLKYEEFAPEPAAAVHIENRVDGGRAVQAVDLEQTDRAASAVAAPHGPGTGNRPGQPTEPMTITANSPSSQSENPSQTCKTPTPSPRKLLKRNSCRRSAPLRTGKPSDASESSKEAAVPMEPVEVPLMRGSFSTPASSSSTKHHRPARRGHQDHDSRRAATLPRSSPGGTDSSTPSTSLDLAAQFAPLEISIPTDHLLDDAFMTGFSFSKRGSLMFGGKRATMQPPVDVATDDDLSSSAPAAPLAGGNGDNDEDDLGSSRTNNNNNNNKNSNSNNSNIIINNINNTEEMPPPPPSLSQTVSNVPSTERASSSMTAADAVVRTPPSVHKPPPDIRVLSPDIEKESQKVRSLYETGDAINWEDGARFSFCEHLEPTPEVPAEEDPLDPYAFSFWLSHNFTHVERFANLWPLVFFSVYSAHEVHLGSAYAGPRSVSSFSQCHDSLRRESEMAGGFEDWDDVDGADVDRYGFIAPPRLPTSRVSTPTELKSAQFSPRRRHVLQKRDPMGFSSQLGGGRVPSRKVSARSLNTVNSEVSVASMRSSRSVMRQASNFLPHNRNRRWMDEAGDMLTISPTLQDSVEEARVEKISESLKRKEWERSEKWRRMAKVSKQGEQGEGMEFEFDIKNPKLVERTWKGIPDRWRGAAWWSFLTTAAEEHKDSPSAEDIIKKYHKLQERSSSDDVQIDLDVPRTISRHIMFRRRYRGGQRLLFRVLHALSIYYPETGYVQGMASLAATLLCYFDEEKAFVMIVRMWQLRGLERLYRPGFEGLMTALREFDQSWLTKAMSEKLSDLGIDTTAYGTRWYLTLFNLSIPFPAQLRVWDVFLLLGDSFKDAAAQPTTSSTTTSTTQPSSAPGSRDAPAEATGLDILHATSAALMDALREVLLDSDFENAMKALTSWIPVKDEDLLMKVTKAEWKNHQGKKKT